MGTVTSRTFTAGSSSISTYLPIGGDGDCKEKGGIRFVRVSATSTGSSGSAVLELACVVNGVVVARHQVTATVTALRAGLTGAGDYILSIAWTGSNTPIADIASCGDPGVRWYIGVASLATIANVTVYADPL